jgi:nucleotide-binding universal stress UspA family protein
VRDAVAMRPQPETPSSRVGPAFGSILCGVDGSRPSFEAARQAAVLADEGTALRYVAVTWEQGFGANAVATLSHARGEDALRRVRDEAQELGVRTTVEQRHAADACRRLIELAGGHDLLVVGIHGRSRVPGIVLGKTAATLVHRSPIPVLVARRPPSEAEFPQDILLAVDGTPASHVAAEAAARIARRHGSRVAIIAAATRDEAERRELAEEAAAVLAATGSEPVMLDEYGSPHRAVAAAAAELGTTLVVCGSRGLHGIAALRSTSKRIAHAAPCSVLVMRPAPAER